MHPGTVTASLSYDVHAPAEIVLQVAVAGADDRLTVLGDGRPLEVVELPGDGGRQHLVRAEPGMLTVAYSATVPASPGPGEVGEPDRVRALRPSRYCPSDRLAGFAGRMFGAGDDAERVRAVTGWVAEHLSYEAGSSGPETGAVDTLLAARGVCRDYAHLVAALCRAVNVPARVAAVYAPGLSPMDFHLVVETALDGCWRVWDATRLAPRQTLIRIATGRDAADVAFATVLSGAVTPTGMEITAVAAGDLPADDHTALVTLG